MSSRPVSYARLWWRFFVIAFARQTEYRLSFLVDVGEGIAQLGLAVLTFWLIYRYTDEVAGWSQAQVLLLVGIYRIVDGLIALQIAPNMRSIVSHVRDGEMDFLLLRPVSSQFLVSLRRLSLPEGVNVLIGLGLTIYAGNLAGVSWGAFQVLEAAAFGICGLALLYCLWLFIVTFAFWLVDLDTLDTLFYGLFEAARYPVSFFRGPLRALFTFVVPAAFATTFPTEALLGRADSVWLLVGVALSVLALLGTHRFWQYAVRHYSSASS